MLRYSEYGKHIVNEEVRKSGYKKVVIIFISLWGVEK